MPELPEVETYVRELAPVLSGRTIVGADVRWPRTIAAPAPEAFADAVAGQRFERFGRRGKYMLFDLASGDTLIVHLRMTGKLQPQAGDAPVDKHTHVLFDLDDGQRLHYHDTRKFGRIWLVADPGPVLAKLGPEPLGDEFSSAEFAAALATRKAAIKALLLDQSIVAGVGNIYADEALYLAGIEPARRGGELHEQEIKRLHRAVQTVLRRGIEYQGSSLGGSSLQNYIRPGGEQGGFQEEFNVFRRTGQPCPACGTPIERITIAQRSTHFCPECQR
jgi:formamidopyrimidine-DNA glycosylase